MPGKTVSNQCDDVRRVSTPAYFLDRYWRALEEQGWEAIVLHSWRDLPQRIDSDIDYAVRGPTPGDLMRFLFQFSRRHGWHMVQAIEHEPGAIFCVCQQAAPPFEALQLDVTWSYRRRGHVLLSAELLFENNRTIPGKVFRVPSPGSEFIYLLAKAAAKGKDFGRVEQRLDELLHEDAEGCHSIAGRAFGEVPPADSRIQSWEMWLGATSAFKPVRRGRKFGIGELGLYLRRIFSPTGFYLIVGPDPYNRDVEYVVKNLLPSFREWIVITDAGLRNYVRRKVALVRTHLVINVTTTPRYKPSPDAIVARALETLASRLDKRLAKTRE